MIIKYELKSGRRGRNYFLRNVLTISWKDCSKLLSFSITIDGLWGSNRTSDLSSGPDGHCLDHFCIYNFFHNKKRPPEYIKEWQTLDRDIQFSVPTKYIFREFHL
jgi:hypothetical protein